MPDLILDLASIGELHRYYDYEKPKRPLITVINLDQVKRRNRPPGEVFYRMGFYSIACKRFQGSLKYGRSYYDFEEGTLMFTAPHQVISSSPDLQVQEGWMLAYHPDFIHASELGRRIHTYSYFQYQVHEALHVSEEERLILKDCVDKIKREYSQPLDKHTQSLIVSTIELVLNYCSRFYDRQFITRAKVNHDLLQRSEHLLNGYFKQDTLIEVENTLKLTQGVCGKQTHLLG